MEEKTSWFKRAWPVIKAFALKVAKFAYEALAASAAAAAWDAMTGKKAKHDAKVVDFTARQRKGGRRVPKAA